MRQPVTRVLLAAASAITLAVFGLSAGTAQASRNPVNRPAWPCPKPNALVVNWGGSEGTGTVLPFSTFTDHRSHQPIPVGGYPDAIAITPDGWTAYVADYGLHTVTPLSLGTCSALPPIAIAAGSGTLAIAVTPDGATAYVVDTNGKVTPIRTATSTTLSPITVPLFGPGATAAIAITPDGSTAYVVNSRTGTVTEIDTATNSAVGSITVGSDPVAIAITPDGTTAYVVNRGSGTVTPIDTATNMPGMPIKVGSSPVAIAITPDGAAAYVVNSGSGTVSQIPAGSTTAHASIKVGSSPAAVAITPDGTTAYVANSGSGNVTPIQIATNTALPAIGVGSDPVSVAVSVNGQTAYSVNNGSGTLTPISTATNTTLPAIKTGGSPTIIAIAPHTPYKSAILTSGRVGLGVTQWGDLNVPGQAPSAEGTRTYGLRYLPTNNEFTGAGCPCEGWGVADTDTDVTGYADQGTGTSGLKVLGFRRPTGGATSTVAIGTTFRVTNAYSPVGAIPDLFQDLVTITNISGANLNQVFYRRLVDWDIEPTAYNEYVTIEGLGDSPALTGVTNDGFDSADPLSSSDDLGVTGNVVRYGPMDQGAQFNFDFGSLAAGASINFTVYYGAAASQAQAYADLGRAGVEAYSLGEPSLSSDGTPNTAMIGFSGIGGSPLTFPPLTLHGAALPDGRVLAPYDQALPVAGGTAPYAWDVGAGGSLPPGLTLESGGVLDGTPTSAGTWQFTAQVYDSAGSSATATFTVTIDPSYTTPDAISQYDVSDDLNCAMYQASDISGEMEPDDCGTFIAVGGQLYGPADVPIPVTFNSWDSTGQTMSGSGTKADPYVTTTHASADGSPITLTQTDTYHTGGSTVATATTLSNSSGSPVQIMVYHGFECYPGDSDTGTGFASNGAVSCISDNVLTNGIRTLRLRPLTAGYTYVEEADYQLWSDIAAQGPFSDTVHAYSDAYAEGVAWQVTVPAHGSVTVLYDTDLLLTHGPA